MHIREANESDLPGVLAIYNDVIVNTTAVYFDEPVSLDNRVEWFRGRRAKGFPVIVAVDETDVIGFASFGEFRASPCYRFTVEHTVHVRADQRRRGVGRALVEALIPKATAMGKHVIVAGIDADNTVSMRLHESLGFERAASFRQVGRKFGRWLDLVFMQRGLEAPPR